jgi:hypothetical protein
MRLGFIRAPAEILAHAYHRVSARHVWVERQSPLAFGDALAHAIGSDLNVAQPIVGSSIVWRLRQHFRQVGSAAT